MKSDAVIVWSISTGILGFAAGMYAQGSTFINVPDSIWTNLLVTFVGGAWIALITSQIIYLKQTMNEFSAKFRNIAVKEAPDGSFYFAHQEEALRLKAEIAHWADIFEDQGQKKLSFYCLNMSEIINEIHDKRFSKLHYEAVSKGMSGFMRKGELKYLPIICLRHVWPNIQ